MDTPAAFLALCREMALKRENTVPKKTKPTTVWSALAIKSEGQMQDFQKYLCQSEHLFNQTKICELHFKLTCCFLGKTSELQIVNEAVFPSTSQWKIISHVKYKIKTHGQNQDLKVQYSSLKSF